MSYRIKDTIAHRELEGRVMILRPDDPNLLSLNPTGRVVWRGLLRGHSTDALVRSLQREFEVSADEARQDVQAFIDQLVAAGIIES